MGGGGERELGFSRGGSSMFFHFGFFFSIYVLERNDARRGEKMDLKEWVKNGFLSAATILPSVAYFSSSLSCPRR